MKIFGIEEGVFDELIFLITQNPNIEKVVLFGSRAMGRYNKGSDIDLALFGKNVKLNDQLDLTWKLEKLDYPYTYDFQIYKNLKDPDVIKHIDRIGIIIYQKLPKGKSEWDECKLGDKLELHYGKGLRKTDRKKGDYPVYGSNGIVGYHNNYLVKAPGIIIGRKGSVGEIKFTNKDFFPIDTTYYVELKSEDDIQFFYYLLLTLQFSEMNSHSAVPGLNRNDVYSIDIKLPKLPEQKEIALVLSSLDDKIDFLHRQNKTLEEMAETLFRKWFIEERDESWEECTLGEIANFGNGKSRPQTVEGGHIPIYGGNGIIGYTDQFNYSNKKLIIGRVGAYCGSIFYDSNDVWVSDNALVVYSNNISTTSYIYFLLKHFKINEMAEGSSHPLITQRLLKSVPVFHPKQKIVDLFVEQADNFLERIDLNKRQIRTLEKLRDIILPKLMSGEVRVNM